MKRGIISYVTISPTTQTAKIAWDANWSSRVRLVPPQGTGSSQMPSVLAAVPSPTASHVDAALPYDEDHVFEVSLVQVGVVRRSVDAAR